MRRILKILTILLAPVYLPLGMYIALNVDEGSLSGYIALVIGMVLYLVDAYIFWYLIENKR